MAHRPIDTKQESHFDSGSQLELPTGLRILVVDDDLADAMAAQLQQNISAIVVTAHDGTTGLELATGQPFEMILLNYRMAGMNGAEVLRRLRDSDRATPVIMITARERCEIPEPIDTFALDGFLTKPFGFRSLIAEMTAVLTARRRLV